ncbi:Uncharacterised protein [Candidatus Tiddalikarchaeum anstoanum]|nr:Uncharacterised protein [Candidatus Tiddalikarchaeum anstoanum]
MLMKDFFKITWFKLLFTLIFSFFIILDVARHLVLTTPIDYDFISVLNSFFLALAFPIMLVVSLILPVFQGLGISNIIIAVFTVAYYYLLSCIIIFLKEEINKRVHVEKENENELKF